MNTMSWLDIITLLEQSVRLYVYSCGQRFKLSLNEKGLPIYKHKYDDNVCKLESNTSYCIGVYNKGEF